MPQCGKSDSQPVDVSRIGIGPLLIEHRSRVTQVGANSPAAVIHIDSDVLAMMLGLDLVADVSLVDFVAEASDFVSVSLDGHGVDLAAVRR